MDEASSSLSVSGKHLTGLTLIPDKVSRLYEQGADCIRIETDLKRWWQWVRIGVDGVLSVGDRTRFSSELVRYFVNAPYKICDRTTGDRYKSGDG